MPARSSKVLEKKGAAGEYELPYISKSRVMSWLKNPEHFRLKYLEGLKEPETEAMRRGTDIHETFEAYYEHITETGSAPEVWQTATALPDNRTQWADYLTPYLSNFLEWENRRREASDNYQPVAIEEELWMENPVDESGPELMGLADVVLPAGSVPALDEDNGVVIVDFKTGKVPKEKYRTDDGIYTELEYYTILFEKEYDVAGAVAFYPRTGETIVKQSGEREIVLDAITNMQYAVNEYNGEDCFEAKSGPLCGWSPDKDDRSSYYGICSQCTWNVPVDNRERFETLLDNGYSLTRIADELGCDVDEVSYWKRKLDL